MSNPGYSLTFDAKALDSGVVGDEIRVSLIMSKKIVKGEVRDEKNVILSAL